MAIEPKKRDDLFLCTLKGIYDAEKQILKTLPKMAARLRPSPAIRNAFEKHRDESETHVERLGEAPEFIGKERRGSRCPVDIGYSMKRTAVPGLTSWASSSASQFVSRTQPCDDALLILDGSGVP